MSLQTILVPVDFSKRGDRALEQANELAKSEGARLVVLHAIHLRLMERFLVGDRRNQLVHDTRKELEAHVEPCEGQAEVLVEMGTPADVIMDTARLKNADLVVLGDHGEFHLRDSVLGTTARHVIEHANLPVLVIKTPESKPYRRIMLATDFSDTSRRSIELAMGLFKEATFVIYHGYPIPGNLAISHYNVTSNELDDMLKQMRQEASETLDRFVQTLPQGYAIEKVVRSSTSAAEDITEMAAEKKVDLIALGTKGIGSFLPMMVGSVADSLLRSAPVDILVYKS